MEGLPSQVSGARPGGHQLRREVIVHHQRERILAAAVATIAEKGYRNVSVADIVKRAAIARAKFYENFSSKEDCFLAAYDRSATELTRLVVEACERSNDSVPERMHAALAATLHYLASNPALTRACVVEAPAAGPEMEARRERALKGFASRVRDLSADGDAASLPETVQDSVVGGLYWLVYHAVLSSPPEDLEDLLPELTEFALIPFVGVAEARRAARAMSVAPG